MPATPIVDAFPQSWMIFGHSYYQMAFGTRTQQGRPDGYIRALLYNQQFLNVQNHAQAGSRLSVEGDWGYGRVLQLVKGWTGGAGSLGNTAPYVVGGQGGSQGAYLIGWGINDVGFNGSSPIMNTAYQHALRTVISRCRISTLLSSNAINYPGGTGTLAATGFASSAQPSSRCTGTAVLASNTAGNTITITLPADYTGQTVALCFIGQAGGAGNLVTFSGTSGASGTINTDNLMPSASFNHVPLTVRFKNFTAAQASTTIIITLTTIGTNPCWYDSGWLEADNAPPVIVANTARLCNSPNGAGGYVFTITTSSITAGTTTVAATPSTLTISSNFALASPAGTLTIPSSGGTVTISYTGTTATTLTGVTAAGGGGTYSSTTLTTPGPTDADIIAFNGMLPSLVAEFDGMVQVSDIDGALNKSPKLFSFDGLHMNELGSARIGQAFVNAVNALVPQSPWGHAASLNPPFPVVTPLARPLVTASWYTSDTAGGVSSTTVYTAVAGDVWAIPFFVSSGVAIWTQWSMTEVAGSVAPTVFMAVYEDRMFQGYPCTMHIQPANGSALSLLAAPGVFTSATSAGNGFLTQAMDSGLYWLAIKIVTAGTGVTFATLQGQSPFMPNLLTTGGVPTGTFPANGLNGWKLTGQGAGVFVNRFPSGAVASPSAPYIGLKQLLAQS